MGVKKHKRGGVAVIEVLGSGDPTVSLLLLIGGVLFAPPPATGGLLLPEVRQRMLLTLPYTLSHRISVNFSALSKMKVAYVS